MAKAHKTTTEHFELFKQEHQKWVDFFGLKEWKVYYIHGGSEDDGNSLAWSIFNADNSRIVTIGLTVDLGETIPTEHLIMESAFHEACEMLLYKLYILGIQRFLRVEELEEARHEVIRTLENAVFK
jgi:hypothetical protein